MLLIDEVMCMDAEELSAQTSIIDALPFGSCVFLSISVMESLDGQVFLMMAFL